MDRLRHAIATDERSVVLAVVETPDGSAPDLGEAALTKRPVVRGAGALAMQSSPGAFTDHIGLGHALEGVLIVDDAQWVDPTSMRRLEQVITGGPGPLVAIVAHRPLEPTERWRLERMAESAEAEGVTVVRTSYAQAPLHDLEAGERDVLGAVSLGYVPIPISVLASLLDVDEERALATAEVLVARGLLSESRRGFARSSNRAPVVLGEARLGRIAARLADAFEGENQDLSVVAHLRVAAGDITRAFPALTSAAIEARDRRALGEAYRLASEALVLADGAVPDLHTTGTLHLICGHYLRATGRSEEAADHLARAVGLLEGADRIDARGFQAAVADDSQRPQEAERILALAEWEALRAGAAGKHLSLLSFRSKMLSRIGFAREADDMHARASVLAETAGTDDQRRYVALNRAWVLLDRGEAAAAEVSFDALRRRYGTDKAASAEYEASRARALFAGGRPQEALAALEAARTHARAAEVDAPVFLTELGMMEANLLYGRFRHALEAADRLIDRVTRQLPAWENLARLGRAQALSALGRHDEAREEIASARDVTPQGADGWRLRCRALAVQFGVDARTGRWESHAAKDLADALLQSRYLGWATELMCVVAEQDRGAMADEATILALKVGNPMLAARANAARRVTDDSVAVHVAKLVRRMRDEVPADWMDDWRRAPGIAAALEVPVFAEADDVDVADRYDGVLSRVGLSGDLVLSPAQRRRVGMVGMRRRGRTLPLVAAGLGVAALAAVTAFGVSALTDVGPRTTVVREVVQVESATTIGEPVAIEDTKIDVPESIDFLSGRADHRGGGSRTGSVDAQGPRNVDGYYWRYATAGPIVATPVAQGKNLLVASADGTLYALDLTSGSVLWTLDTEGSIGAAPALGAAALGEGRRPTMVVVAGDDGIVRAREADIEIEAVAWVSPVGTRVRSSPVVLEDEGLVVVASSDGRVTALSLGDGSPVWSYPKGERGLGPISADLAASDGVVYVGTEEGELHVLDALTGETRCSTDLSAPIAANPIVSDGVVYVPTRANTIYAFPAGTCSGTAPDRLPLYVTETPVEVAPAIVGDTMYLPAGRFLYALDLVDYTHRWSPETVAMEAEITAAPVVDSSIVYFGTRDGLMVGVDAVTGRELFRWQTSNIMRASPVVIDGAVYVAAGDGSVTALGPGEPSDGP